MNNQNEDNIDKEPEEKNPKLYGSIYFIVGLTGLAFSIYALIQSLGTVPLYGTVTAGVLIALLSILIIIYGYRVFNRDY